MFMCLWACSYFSNVHYLAVHIYCRSGNLRIKYISSLKVRNIVCICILRLNFALASWIKYFRCENFPIHGNFCLLPKVTFLVCYGVWEQGCPSVVLVCQWFCSILYIRIWRCGTETCSLDWGSSLTPARHSSTNQLAPPSNSSRYTNTCTQLRSQLS